MPATDLQDQVCEALRAILLADTALQALMGGTVRVVDRQGLGEGATLPILAFELLTFDEGSGLMSVLLTGVADGTDGLSVARHLLHAAKSALSWTAFAGHSLDIAPLEGQRTSPAEAGEILGSPDLRQADWTLPLLVA